MRKQGIADYEKQRLSRIAENKARMEALGLHKMASSLMGSSQNSSLPWKSAQRNGKSKVVNDDDDDDSDYQDDDEDFVGHSSSKSSRNKVFRFFFIFVLFFCAYGRSSILLIITICASILVELLLQ